jgi:hypothetical protein
VGSPDARPDTSPGRSPAHPWAEREHPTREVVREFLQHRTYAKRRDFEAIWANHIFPTLGDRPMETINSRAELARLRDDIKLRVGPHAAHAVVRCLNVVGRWYQNERSDRYVWPAIKTPLTKEDRKGRERVLDDHEIAAVGTRRQNFAGRRWWRGSSGCRPSG